MGHRRSHRPAHLRKNLRKTAGMPTISPGFGTPLIPVTTISGLPLFQSIGVLSSKNMQSISLLRIEPPIPSTCGCDNLDIYFLHFFSQRYPQATDLHELSTQDVDDFTSWIRADVQRRKLKNSNTYVNHHIQALAGWLSYLERTDHPIKPHLPLPRLIWPHHYPPLDHRSPSSTIKYIPQAVLEQLDRHLHQLTAVYIPVMIVLRASGWRISDVLALKWETCLVLTPDDLPALEAYTQQILERIEIGKQAGNIHWTLVNQKNLDERVRPAIALLKQGHVLASTDKYEREYSDEEWDQRKPHDREEAHE